MSNSAQPDPADPTQPQPAIDPRLGVLLAVADHLIPLFAAGANDMPLARQMALSAIDAYEPRTRADYVNVARTIAFSMAALALLGQTAAPDMPMTEKLRAFGRANALNRSADQSERTMMQRRHHHQITPRAEPPTQQSSAPHLTDPDPILDDAAVEAAVAEAMAFALGHAKPAPTQPAQATTPAPQAATPRPATPGPAAPPPGAAGPFAQPPAAATRYNVSTPDVGQFRTAPCKDRLLRHSAIQRVVERTDTPHPV